MQANSNANPSWRELVTRDEIDALLAMRDARSWLSVATNWSIIAASFALVAWAPNPLTVLIALILIGARQLGCAVLMHEASHRSLFKNRSLNDWAGNWLCAFPIWSDILPYRPYHLRHHARTGTELDPDLGLTTPFPVTRTSLRRKIVRDLSGQSGLKIAQASWARTFARATNDHIARAAAVGFALTNLFLLGVLTALGHPALYLIWVVAWLTTNQLVTRIRAIAEHALTPDAPEPFGRTRTTLTRCWERLVVAPNRVNFHMEHHLLITVPHYNLPAMHSLLRERGAIGDDCITVGYFDVLRNAASRTERTAPAAAYRPPPRVPPF
jgi:fatty acid desaturase